MNQIEASIAIQVLPKTKNDPDGAELLRIVDSVIGHIKKTGLNYFVGPFETTIEGAFDDVWDCAKECQRICVEEGAEAVSAYIKSVYSPKAGVWSIGEKVRKYHENTQ
ncbi:MAG: thiamine-binding protein [Spirochaetaceae bacterium]|jgi:uncharacterized protein YqgV (UPF0045/DUF77 family)|nr:thiamine-binding protein [Spirochaetaceae bacterium]